MRQKLLREEDLPIQELEKIGLAKDGKLGLSTKALQALLSGKRTELLRLTDLASEGYQIPQLDAKLSLMFNDEGKPELLIHPIYKVAEIPDWLTDDEADDLEQGKAASIVKIVEDKNGKTDNVLIEFDPDTNEFIIVDTERIVVPDMVNNERLSAEQKERFRKGKTVELADGTSFQFSAADPEGIRSNKLALVASIIVDGGISYALYKGLHALFGQKPDESQRAKMSPGYKEALDDLRAQKAGKAQVPEVSSRNEYSRGYSRSGISR